MSDLRTTTEIRNLGPCRINFGSRDMGFTQGGVSAKITTDWKDVTIDEYGVVPVDAIDRGTTIEVTVPLVQASLENYEYALPTGKNSPLDRHTFGRQVGTSIPKYRLIIDPVGEEDGIVIYKAGIVDLDELGYNIDGERVLGCHFKGFIDDTRTNGDKLFRIFGGMS